MASRSANARCCTLRGQRQRDASLLFYRGRRAASSEQRAAGSRRQAAGGGPVARCLCTTYPCHCKSAPHLRLLSNGLPGHCSHAIRIGQRRRFGTAVVCATPTVICTRESVGYGPVVSRLSAQDHQVLSLSLCLSRGASKVSLVSTFVFHLRQLAS